MCFSSEVSFTAAAVLAVIGIATITQARSKLQLPLAALPLFFCCTADFGRLALAFPKRGGIRHSELLGCTCFSFLL